MSRFITPRLLASLAVLALPSTLAAQNVITLRADSARRTIAPSSKLAVPVILDMSAAGGTNLASLTTGVTFGANRLTFDSVKAGFGALTPTTTGAASGSLTLGVTDATGTTTTQTMATMYFTASATAGGTTIAFSPTAAGSATSASILALLRSRALDICVAPSGKWGDVNGDSIASPLGDGAVNIIDAQQIARYSVSLSVANRPGIVARGDVTADGAVNIIDAQQIARFSVGLSAAARTNTNVYAPPTTATISLAPSTPQTVAVGGTMQIAASPRDAANADLTGCASVTWSSSNAAVASVSADGVVTGVANGTATITVTSVANVGVTAVLTVTVQAMGIGLALDQFSLIPAGTFQMGSTAYFSWERPVHAVTISHDFYMQKTEVTQGQWRTVMGSNPSYFSTCGDTCPVETVSWDDIQTFIQQLNASTGVTYRLPTEAEWEYAARAGTTGETYGALDAIAWYGSNSASTTHAVAGKLANAWGLYDMLGNVFEWVNDWYGSYSSASVTDPTGPTTGSDRVVRGGSWYDGGSDYVRAAGRNGYTPSNRNTGSGFRLVATQQSAVASITVTPNPVTLAAGALQQFTAVGRDASGNVVTVTPVWTVVAGGGTINATGLFVAGSTTGTFGNTVHASYNSIMGSATVTVTVGPLSSITVVPNPATLPAGASQQFTAVGRDASGNVVTVTPVWTVVAGGGTINATGLFVAGSTPGTYANTVRATSGTISGTATVTVTPGALATITVTPNPATLAVGALQQFTAVGKDASGNVIAMTPVWTVVAGGGTINATGLFVAGSTPGTYANTVKATSGAASGTSTVTVTGSGGLACTGTPQLGCGLALDQFSLVPAGTFQMGSTAYPGWGEDPVHAVTISHAFYLQKTEVTQGQWRVVMGSNPSYFSTCGDTCPVEQVSWNDIQTFIQQLNASTGVTYRLPTEAEWEYAARAGTTGETYGALDAIAWYEINSASTTHAAAGKLANAWGLYDTIGNVWEWVNDWYGSYSSASVTDPTGPATGSYRVLRGGSWSYSSNYARAAIRLSDYPSSRGGYVGFRLVRTP